MPSIEWSLNAGAILGVLFIAAGFYWTTRNDLKSIKDELKMLRQVVTGLAEQNIRLDNQGTLLASQGALIATLEDRIYKLSQGQGFMQRSIDGEYTK